NERVVVRETEAQLIAITQRDAVDAAVVHVGAVRGAVFQGEAVPVERKARVHARDFRVVEDDLVLGGMAAYAGAFPGQLETHSRHSAGNALEPVAGIVHRNAPRAGASGAGDAADG